MHEPTPRHGVQLGQLQNLQFFNDRRNERTVRIRVVEQFELNAVAASRWGQPDFGLTIGKIHHRWGAAFGRHGDAEMACVLFLR